MAGLDWPGAAAYNAAPVQPWSWNGQPAGTAQASGPLSFVRVYNAGHMAAGDQPGPVQQMFTNFVFGQPVA